MKEIAFFDLESSGVSVTSDRIVQISAVTVDPSSFEIIGEIKDYKFNPGIPIPKEATEVHGITDEMVKYEPSFAARARALFGYLKGKDIGGYNSNRFDVLMLSEEFARVGIEWPEPDTNFLDSMVIYHEEEKRDLKAAFLFYCGAILLNAHDAKSDILATVSVFAAQTKKYEHLKGKTPHEIDQHYGGSKRVDLAATLLKDEQGVIVYNIGKDKGKSVKDNQGFALWMLKQDFSGDTKRKIKEILNLK